MQINPDIFKAYDIRGVYPSDLNEDISQHIGAAFSKLLIDENNGQLLNVVVSSDMRLSSPQIKRSVIEGITQTGINVVDIGLASTPTFYFAVAYYGYDGGIQVSASHNPAEYNGMKMVRSNAIPISGDTGIFQIRDLVIANDLPDSSHSGSITAKHGIIDDLISDQSKDLRINDLKPYTIVIDAANAMGALDCQAFFKTINCQIIPLNFDLDGTFPAHEADPLKPENLEQISSKVIDEKADFGIAVDGDGDRYFVIMDNGRVLPPEILRGILAQEVLKKHPGTPIGYDIRPGRITRDLILEAGGKPFITRVGHSLIKQSMIANGSPFSGESSGHFFYRMPYGSFEMPVKMLSDFLTWFNQKDAKLSQIIKPYQKYYHSGEINSLVKDPLQIFSKLKQQYQDAKEISELDGVYFEYDDFWFNVRSSNTEPKIRLNLEAVSEDLMHQKRDEVLAIINS